MLFWMLAWGCAAHQFASDYALTLCELGQSCLGEEFNQNYESQNVCQYDLSQQLAQLLRTRVQAGCTIDYSLGPSCLESLEQVPCRVAGSSPTQACQAMMSCPEESASSEEGSPAQEESSAPTF